MRTEETLIKRLTDPRRSAWGKAEGKKKSSPNLPSASSSQALAATKVAADKLAGRWDGCVRHAWSAVRHGVGWRTRILRLDEVAASDPGDQGRCFCRGFVPSPVGGF